MMGTKDDRTSSFSQKCMSPLSKIANSILYWYFLYINDIFFIYKVVQKSTAAVLQCFGKQLRTRSLFTQNVFDASNIT